MRLVVYACSPLSAEAVLLAGVLQHSPRLRRRDHRARHFVCMCVALMWLLLHSSQVCDNSPLLAAPAVRRHPSAAERRLMVMALDALQQRNTRKSCACRCLAPRHRRPLTALPVSHRPAGAQAERKGRRRARVLPYRAASRERCGVARSARALAAFCASATTTSPPR